MIDFFKNIRNTSATIFIVMLPIYFTFTEVPSVVKFLTFIPPLICGFSYLIVLFLVDRNKITLSNRELQSKNTKLEERITQLLSELSSAQNNNNGLKENLHDYKKENKQLIRVNSELRKGLSELQHVYGWLISQTDHLTIKKAELIQRSLVHHQEEE